MRRIAKLTIALLVVVCMTALLSGASLAQTSDALVRFVHALPGAGAVDIYVNDAPAVRALGFGEASAYLRMPAGAQHIVTTQSGATTPLWQQDFAPTAGQSFTLVVSSTNPLTYAAFPDDLNSLPLGSARITAVHAIADAPTVDVVLADGRAVVAGLNYNQPYGTLDIPALTYELGVVPAGASVSDALIAPAPFSLDTGTSYMLVAYGSATNPQVLALSAPTNAEGNSGYVRFAHGVPGGPAVDVYANDTLIVPNLSEGESTDYIALPEGNYAVSLRATGTSDSVADASLSVGMEERITAAALLDGETVVVQPFADDTAAVDQLTAGFSVINGVLGASPVNLTLQSADGAPLTAAIAGGAQQTAALTATDAAPTLMVNYGGSTSDNVALNVPVIYGGAYYTALAVSAESGIELIEFPPVSLAQTIGSAPGSSLVSAQPEPAVVVELPTAEPQVVEPVAPASDSEVVQATPPPAATAAPSGPTGRIILDPGANLQLRQYPSRDAFSLGLAPSGTVLIVNGREGAPVFLPDVATPTLAPEATEFVDPATLLEADADLAPGDTWLNVDYIAPDGGTINAWVNAQFLDVRDARGRKQRLADLPLVPNNQAGEARNTAVTPPPLPENIVQAIVLGLDAGVNLQIRRTPSTSGESLALVPNDTVMELLGVNEAREWAFVRYVQPEGGIVRGWVSTRFLRYTFRDRSIDYEEMETRELLNIIEDTQRGDMLSGAAGPIAPTQNPLRDVVVGTIQLNAGANLHLRRNPNANSESLALMPDGTQLIVSGRTDTAEWVQVEFEGQVGWTSSRYLSYTFNGASYDLQAIPVTVMLGITPTPEVTPSA
ncbi:MAG: DUF4397 domain-containing protein [Anaerolineae bacterium]|nr:DUF4397 domain-containing protein [Anaerolineae bacterium]